MANKINPKYISPDMTDDVELALERSSRQTQDLEHTSRLNALRARVRQVCLSSPMLNPSGISWAAVGTGFHWVNSRNASYKNPVLLFSATVGSRRLEVRLVNNANGTVLGSMFVPENATGHFTLAFNRPTTDCVIELQMRQETNGQAPTINQSVFEFDTITGQ